MNSRTSILAILTTLTLLVAPLARAATQFSDSRLIVKFRSRPSVTRGTPGPLRSGSVAVDALLRQFDAEALEQLFPPVARNPELQEQLGMDRFWVVQMRHPVDIRAAASAFANLGDVELAEPDYIMTCADAATASLVPNDPQFPMQWGFRNTGSNSMVPGIAGADIKAVPAWDITTGDPSVLVAVLDSGLRMDHPEFAGRVWTNSGEIPGNNLDDDGNGYVDDVHGYDFVNNDADPSDDLFHGTAVTSVIAANGNNGSLIAGLDWSCRILPLKVVNSSNFGLYSWWEAGIYYAVSMGARVVNMSLVGYDPSASLGSAMHFAHNSGCFIAAAMGNDNIASPSFPAMFDEWVTAVGSTDPMDHRCVPSVCGYGSNFGPHIDVVAPGTEIAALLFNDTGSFFSPNGTSFATPMVAGLASLLLAKNPSLTPDEIRSVIRYSADDQVGSPEEDMPGFDNHYGYGRINCLRALNLVRSIAPPVVTAPGSVSTQEGTPLVIEVSASDPDGDPIQTLTADFSNLPPGHNAVFVANADHSAGRLDWTPDYIHAGTYSLAFTASSPFQGSAATVIQVANVNDPPLLVAPAYLDAFEGLELVVDVSVSDVDGDPITSLSAEPLPPGAAFTTSADRKTGRLRWTPGFNQQGPHSLRFIGTSTSATPALTLESVVNSVIDVADVDKLPIVTLPPRVEGIEGALISVNVSAADPDGDPVTDLKAGPLPPGAAFAASPDHSSGELQWTPGFAQSGQYFVTVTATSQHVGAPGGAPESQNGHGGVLLVIADAPDHPPVITAPAQVTGAEGVLLSVEIEYSDADGDDILEVGASPLPAGATFTPGAGHSSSALAWTPTFDQAGIYTITLSARSAHRPSPVSEPVSVDGFANMQITVTDVNRPPVAVAGGPYVGMRGALIAFNGVGSFDPDGQPLQFSWDFGDDLTGSGATPLHSYASTAGSPFTVILTVSDGSLSGTASTTAAVQDIAAAKVFYPFNLDYIFPQILPTVVWIEPVHGSFTVNDAMLSSVSMRYNGATILTGCKNTAGIDRNHNGVAEIRACFARNDLKTLFASLPNGMSEVQVTVGGELLSGGRFEGTTTVHVIKLGFLGAGSLALVSPNPINPQGKLTFVTTQPGVASVQVFDLNGRLVRNLMAQQSLSPGIHEVTVDGRNEQGSRLASGIYYYRVRSVDGVSKGAFTVLK